MANKNDLFDFDETTAVNNDNIQGANIAENCAPSGINNAIRGLAAIVKRAIGSQGSAIASAATTAIGAAGTALYTTVTGATSITSFGSVGAGTLRIVEFTGVLTLTHNATSLKLPGSANITTAAGDIGFFLSLGSGNWKCLHYSKADGSAVANFSGTLTSTDPGSTGGPDFVADRNSASPASNDILGSFVMRGRSSTAAARNYARLRGVIIDPLSGSEDGQTIISAMVNGSEIDVSKIGPGVQIGSPAGGDKGLGTINLATSLYLNGGLVHLRLQKALVSTAVYDSTASNIPFDDSLPQNTEGKQLFSLSFVPLSASSTIRIHGIVHAGVNSTADCKIAGFNSAIGTSAIFASEATITSAGMISMSFFHEEAALNTSSRTYSMRYGPAAGETMQINGVGGGRKLGGALTSYMVVEEWL
jgi:hypothetical protein